MRILLLMSKNLSNQRFFLFRILTLCLKITKQLVN